MSLNSIQMSPCLDGNNISWCSLKSSLCCPPHSACPSPPRWCSARCSSCLWRADTQAWCSHWTRSGKKTEKKLKMKKRHVFCWLTSLFILMRAMSLLNVLLTKSGLMNTWGVMIIIRKQSNSHLVNRSDLLKRLLLSSVMISNDKLYVACVDSEKKEFLAK